MEDSALMLFGCFIPFQVVLLPMARMLGLMGLAGTIPGLIFVSGQFSCHSPCRSSW